MSRKKKQHNYNLPKLLKKYADSRTLDYKQMSTYHCRVIDKGYAAIDVWTTGKYYVLQTSYHELTKKQLVERGGETGFIYQSEKELFEWLDKLFFIADMLNDKEIII